MHPFPPHHSTPPPPYSCSTGLQRFHIIIARYCHIARWLQHESSTTGSACITTNYLTTAGCHCRLAHRHLTPAYSYHCSRPYIIVTVLWPASLHW